MADQRPWWKLWVSALEDPDLKALSLENWARWARLGAFVKMHGECGSVRVPFDGRSLRECMRISDVRGGERGWLSLLSVVRMLPGVTLIVEGHARQQVAIIIFRNWKKYQDDNSAERTRKWRAKQRVGDGTASHGDGKSASRGGHSDGHQSSRGDGVEVEVEVEENPPTPVVKSSPGARPQAGGQAPHVPEFTWPSREAKASSLRVGGTKWLPGRWPYEAFLHDCSDPSWRGRCVRQDYADAHPHQHPATMAGAPMQCPQHTPVRA